MLALRWDNTTGFAHLVQDDVGALGTDFSLETQVLISIFTNAEASQREMEVEGLDFQQGWWADSDSLRAPGARRMGSKLWLLSRGKTTQDTLRRAESYVLESLLWLKEAGIVSKITVLATKLSSGMLGLDVSLTRPNKLLPVYQRLWQVRHDAFQ
jgi:phage gp46-like protein